MAYIKFCGNKDTPSQKIQFFITSATFVFLIFMLINLYENDAEDEILVKSSLNTLKPDPPQSTHLPGQRY